MRRVVQLLPSMAYGDAISNHALALRARLLDAGIVGDIYAESIDARLSDDVRPAKAYEPHPDDVVLYHLSTSSRLNRKVAEFPGKLVLNWHNITPPHFFEPYDATMAESCRRAHEDLSFLSDKACYAISDSDFNMRQLQSCGFRCPCASIPILLDFKSLDAACAAPGARPAGTESRPVEVLFVGRIAPNKCQEDVIRAFWCFKSVFRHDAHLTLVGNYNNMEGYYLRLKRYARALGLEDSVAFEGHIGLAQLVSLYRSSDLFLCQSEHEGFCVPLVEAMHFRLPIVAYDCTAVGETLGEGGLPLGEKDPMATAAVMDALLRDDAALAYMRDAQRARLADFDSESVFSRYLAVLDSAGRVD